MEKIRNVQYAVTEYGFYRGSTPLWDETFGRWRNVGLFLSNTSHELVENLLLHVRVWFHHLFFKFENCSNQSLVMEEIKKNELLSRLAIHQMCVPFHRSPS